MPSKFCSSISLRHEPSRVSVLSTHQNDFLGASNWICSFYHFRKLRNMQNSRIRNWRFFSVLLCLFACFNRTDLDFCSAFLVFQFVEYFPGIFNFLTVINTHYDSQRPTFWLDFRTFQDCREKPMMCAVFCSHVFCKVAELRWGYIYFWKSNIFVTCNV